MMALNYSTVHVQHCAMSFFNRLQSWSKIKGQHCDFLHTLTCVCRVFPHFSAISEERKKGRKGEKGRKEERKEKSNMSETECVSKSLQRLLLRDWPYSATPGKGTPFNDTLYQNVLFNTDLWVFDSDAQPLLWYTVRSWYSMLIYLFCPFWNHIEIDSACDVLIFLPDKEMALELEESVI